MKRKLNRNDIENFNNQFKIKNLVGEGTYGKVYTCFKNKNTTNYAVKVIKKKYIDYGIKEYNILKKTQSIQNNLTLFGEYNYKDTYSFVMEYIPYTLDYIIDNKSIDLELLKSISRQIFSFLDCLHNLKIIHSDIKPDNILFNDKTKKVVLIDYSNAMYFHEVTSYDCSYIQTREYRSPEIILKLSCDSKIDIWSCGCILVELITYKILFDKTNSNSSIETIINILGYPTELSRNIKIKKYINKKSKLSEIIHTSDFSKKCDKNQLKLFIDFINKIFIYNSEKRYTSKQLLQHLFIK